MNAVLTSVYQDGSAFIPVRWRLPDPERVHLHSARRAGTPPGLPWGRAGADPHPGPGGGTPPGLPWGRPPGRLSPARRAGAPAEQAGPGVSRDEPAHRHQLRPSVGAGTGQPGPRGLRHRADSTPRRRAHQEVTRYPAHPPRPAPTNQPRQDHCEHPPFSRTISTVLTTNKYRSHEQ